MRRILYRGGRVYSPVPDATALLTVGTQVAWVGADAAAAGLEPDAVVELEGAWLAPAFVDAHVHVVAAGLALTVLDLSAEVSLEGVLRRVRQAAAAAREDALIWGTGWDETRWGSADLRRAPSPSELDRAGGGRPVYLARTDLHTAAASSMLLRSAALPVADAPVRGDAHHALRRAAHGLLTGDQRRVAAEAFFVSAARSGIGMVHECSGPQIAGDGELAVVQEAARLSGIDLVSYWGEAGSAGVTAAVRAAAQPAGDIFVDGSLGSRTAALSAPYFDGGCGRLDNSDDDGALFMQPAEISDHLVAATRAGAQAGFHAIGDAAISAVVQALGLAASEVGAPALAAARHRIEHLEMCTAEHRSILARYGIIASVQPAFDAKWGGLRGMYASRVGGERASAMNDLAALAAAGIPLAFGSDAPVTPVDPWGALRAATMPTTEGHALSARAAFAAHTRGGHRAARRDNGGVLRRGADATFAIWNRVESLGVSVPDDRVAAWSTDPRAGAAGLPSLEGPSPQCSATVVRGRPVYDVGVLAEAVVNREPRNEVHG